MTSGNGLKDLPQGNGKWRLRKTAKLMRQCDIPYSLNVTFCDGKTVNTYQRGLIHGTNRAGEGNEHTLAEFRRQ